MSECAAILQRRALIEEIKVAAKYNPRTKALYMRLNEGTEAELLTAMSVLQGIVNEYMDGGDQMLEECTCNSPEEHHVKYSG